MKRNRTVESVPSNIPSLFREQRCRPTCNEMVGLLEIRPTSVVHFWTQKLLRQDPLEKDSHGFPKPPRQSLALPLMGSIQAGFPSPAEEELCDILSLDDYLVTRPDSSFLLKVSGDSMVEAGIREGDLVIVERNRSPKNGDIILAEVDGEWTMTYFLKKGSTVSLEAANSRCQPILPRSELSVAGIVTAVIRKYHP